MERELTKIKMQITKNIVEKRVQVVARKTKQFDHAEEMKKFDREARVRRAKQEDYSDLIGQQVLQ